MVPIWQVHDKCDWPDRVACLLDKEVQLTSGNAVRHDRARHGEWTTVKTQLLRLNEYGGETRPKLKPGGINGDVCVGLILDCRRRTPPSTSMLTQYRLNKETLVWRMILRIRKPGMSPASRQDRKTGKCQQ